jgi:hypothetical protein
MTLTERLSETARQIVFRDKVPELVAATLEWNEESKHLHLSFFLDGIPQDIDLESLDLAVGEVINDHWQSIATAGTSYVFDVELLARALCCPHLIFRR